MLWRGWLVVAVEGSEEMVHRGAENAQNNGLSQVKFYSQDLTKDFSHHSWAKQGFDALLIDPPRSGAEEVMQYMCPNLVQIELFMCHVIQQPLRVMPGYWYNKATV